MSRTYRKEHGQDFIELKITPLRHEGKIKYLELYQREGIWFASIVLETGYRSKIRTDGNMYIDIGIRNLAAVHDGESTTIYKGGEVSSIQRYKDKKMAELQGALATHGKRTSKKKKGLCRRLTAQASHAIHTLTKRLVDKAEKEKKGIVVGDLTNLRKEKKYNKNANQKIHQWQFGRMIEQLKYKCRQEGIPFEKVPERDTSKTCVLCGKKENGRVKRGLYRCRKYRKEFNADCGGANNIKKKYLRIPLSEGSGIGVVGSLASPVVALWNGHDWIPQGEANL
jgi:putative transposase